MQTENVILEPRITQGEWIANGNEHNRITWIEANGKRLCTMKECEEDWYNAKTMAASKDMLIALRTALHTLKQLNTDAVCDNTILIVTQAIKKATK